MKTGLETFNQDKINQVVEKWKAIGFLNSDTIKNKQNVALSCELTEMYLSENTDKYTMELKTLIYPVVVRVFGKYDENITIETISNKVTQIAEEFSTKLETEDKSNWTPVLGNDAEKEFVIGFSDNYII